MLRWTIIFLVVAVVAAILGFGGIAGAASSIAQYSVLYIPGVIYSFFRNGPAWKYLKRVALGKNLSLNIKPG